LGIDHRRVVGAHPAGAGRMKNRRAVLARKRQQVGLGINRRPWSDFGGYIVGQRLGARQLARE